MPVRSTIHSSVVSTRLGELVVGDLARRAARCRLPRTTERGSLRGPVGEGVGAEIVEIVADLAGDVVADHPRRDVDRVGDALGGGAAVALHDQAVEAEEDRAIVVVGVEVVP